MNKMVIQNYRVFQGIINNKNGLSSTNILSEEYDDGAQTYTTIFFIPFCLSLLWEINVIKS